VRIKPFASRGLFLNRGKRRIRNARHTASNDVRLCRSRRRSEIP
jgi:hypothetical protein